MKKPIENLNESVDFKNPRFFFSANEYISFLCMFLVVNNNSGAKIIYR